jgi:hypothetical protein
VRCGNRTLYGQALPTRNRPEARPIRPAPLKARMFLCRRKGLQSLHSWVRLPPAPPALGDDLQHPPSIRHDRLRKAQQAAASGPFRSRPLFLPPSAVRIRLATLLAHVAIWVNSASPLQFQPSRSRVGPPQDAPNASLASENYGRPHVTHPLLGGAGSPRTEKGPVGARGARRSACQ